MTTTTPATGTVTCDECGDTHRADYSHEGSYGEGAIYAVVCGDFTDYYRAERVAVDTHATEETVMTSAPATTRTTVVRYQGNDYTVRQTPKLTTTVWLGSARVTKTAHPGAFHAIVGIAFDQWEAQDAAAAHPGEPLGAVVEETVAAVGGAVRVGQYPPLSTEEAEAALDAGLVFVAEGAGGYSFLVQERTSRRHLGKVRAVTETMGSGVWHRFAAYRPDGSRVDYARTRLDAAKLLRGPSPEVVKAAVAQFQEELTRNADAIGRIMSEPLPGETPEPGPVSLSDTVAPHERVVRRDGEELGRVRRERGRTESWQAWDVHGIRRIDHASTSEEAARLLVAGIDRREADAAERDAWLKAESDSLGAQIAEVLPSGEYGVKRDTARAYTGPEPVLHVIQRTSAGRWVATPGRWAAVTLAGRAGGRLAIDHGAGWVLSEEDTAALVALAKAELSRH